MVIYGTDEIQIPNKGKVRFAHDIYLPQIVGFLFQEEEISELDDDAPALVEQFRYELATEVYLL